MDPDYESSRQAEPFIAINCAAIPETPLESELIGYEKGAFTDARAQKRGLFELADNGTQFLDEIGEIPPTLQAKPLRVLEEQSFRRLGGLKDIHPLLAHDWPGNVREPRNALERAMILEDSSPVGAASLPVAIRRSDVKRAPAPEPQVEIADSGLSPVDNERQLLARALERTGGNQTQAARLGRLCGRAAGRRNSPIRPGRLSRFCDAIGCSQ